MGVTRPHRRGFPCCVGSPCAGMPPPIPRWDPWSVSRREGWSPPVSRDGGLPRIATGSAPTSGCFGACIGVHSRCGLPARRTAKAARCLEGFDGFVTSAAAPIATGWSDQLSGRESHPLKIRAFSRRTATHAPGRSRYSACSDAFSRPWGHFSRCAVGSTSRVCSPTDRPDIPPCPHAASASAGSPGPRSRSLTTNRRSCTARPGVVGSGWILHQGIHTRGPRRVARLAAAPAVL